MQGVRAGLAIVFALTTAGAAGAARADDPTAPPTLTPASAAAAAEACPNAARYANALVTGIGQSEAAAAIPAFRDCARAVRLPDLRWKNAAASLALAAAELSEGVLTHDAALLKSAAGETDALRRSVPVDDANVRSWNLIPDVYDMRAHAVAYVPGSCGASPAMNAAYIDVAARDGVAWLRTPEAMRSDASCRDVRVARAAFAAASGVSITSGTAIVTTGAYDPQTQQPPDVQMPQNSTQRPPR